MSTPGTIRLPQVNVTPSAPPSGYILVYTKSDDMLYIQDSSGTEIPIGSTTAITTLTGEGTASGPGAATLTLTNSAVIGKVLTGFSPGPNSTVLASDTILEAFEKIQAQITASTGAAITALTGDVSATGPGSSSATVNSVGGSSASDIHSAELAANAATASNTSSTIVERDASGNFSANIITSDLTGDVTGNVSGSSSTFTGALSGDVTGTQSATVVDAIQGTEVNSTAPTDAQLLVYNSLVTQWVPESISGDATINRSGALTLGNSGVSANSYGSSTEVGTFTVDSKGRITVASNTTITGTSPGGSAGGDLSGTYPNPSIASGVIIPSKLGTVTDGITLDQSGTGSTLEIKSGGVGTTQLSDSSVTNAKLDNMVNNTVKGNQSGITTAPSDISLGSLSESTSSVLTIGGTNTVIGNTTIQVTKSDTTHDGYLSSTDWNTFNNKQSALTIGNLTDVGTDGITVTGGTGAVIGIGTSIAQHVSDTTHNGYLSSTDWNTFNNKQAALTIGNLTDGGTDGIVVTGGTNSVIGTGTSITQHVADTTHNGYLSSTDWNTFNGKQASGNYITALTGDVTASGPGSVAGTISVGSVTDTKASLANKPSCAVVATTNQTLSGIPTIDGISTLIDGSLVLLSAQTTGSQNGPWVIHSGAWTRPTWYPSGGTTQSFQFICILIRLGTSYQGTIWRMTSSGAITIDTTSTTWVVTPLSLNGNTVTGQLLNANLASMAANTIKGNNTGGSTTPSDLTASQVNTMLQSAGAGTVTSVDLTDGIVFSVSGNPITTSGTISLSLISQSANQAFIGPVSGSNTAPTFRQIQTADLFAPSLYFFGDGSDGNLTASSGTTTMSRDMFYNNVTLTGTAKIVTAGFRIFVKGTLDLSGAGASAIAWNGNNGNNASSATGATGGSVLTGGTLGGAAAGGAGGTGSTTNGANGGSGITSANANGGAGANGGSAGAGSSGTAGGFGNGGGVTALPIRRFETNLIKGVTFLNAGVPSGGGGGGGGDTTNAGGGGGGGANGGGVVFISCRTLNRGASTPISCISAIGGIGGNGFSPAAGNTGGGGGGGGGAGGWIYFAYENLTGATGTNMFDTSGGNGGNGGTHHGASGATDGAGGVGGSGGRITLLNLLAGTTSETFGSSGGSASGTTGGSGNTSRVSL